MVTGTVNLGDAAIEVRLAPDLVPNLSDELVIVDNQSTGSIVGTFAGLPEGATLTAGGRRMLISYTGGDGNDVVLTFPPVDVRIDSPVAETIYLHPGTGLVLDATVPAILPAQQLTFLWTQIEGPGTVTIADATAEDTVATFSADGEYRLRLTADNGNSQAYDEVTIKVGAPESWVPEPDLLWYSFDDGSGTTAQDSSGAGRDATIVGAEWVAGRIGSGALSFGGDGDHVLFDDGTFLNGLDAITVSLWVKSNVVGTDAGFLFFKDPDGKDQWGFRYDDEGWGTGFDDVVRGGVNTTAGYIVRESCGNIQTDQWQHVAITWQSGQNMAYYFDGQYEGRTQVPKIGTLTGYEKVLVGKGSKDKTITQGWNGLIDDVRLYNRRLDETEIGYLYSNARPNGGPQVDAGADQTTSSGAIVLAGTVTDDGSPDPPGNVTTRWFQISGPGTASFGDANQLDTNVTFDLPGSYVLRLTADDGEVVTFSDITITYDSATVVARHIFYNNSHFDGYDSAADNSDDDAIATNKTALLPGQKSRFTNYTSYSKGINGIMVDINGLAGTPQTSDFEFRVGNNSDPANWINEPPPPAEILVREDAGINGSDRVTLTWTDGAIQDQWLMITVLATANTGLAQPDVFFFGNAPGECGNNASEPTPDAVVNLSDVILTRNNQTGFGTADIESSFDYNRDQRVNLSDVIFCRNNQSGFTPLNLIDLSGFSATVAAQRVESSLATELAAEQAPAVESAIVDLSLAQWALALQEEDRFDDGDDDQEDDPMAIDMVLAHWPDEAI